MMRGGRAEGAAARARFRLGTALVALSALAFGCITTLSRLAYDGGATPAALVLLRSAVFVVLVGLFLGMRGRRLRLPPRLLPATLWLGAAMLAMSVGYLASVAFIPVSLAALIFYTYPLVVPLLAAAAGRERLTAFKLIAAATAFAGLGLALGPGFAALDPRGVALALTASVGVALAVTFSGPVVRGNDPLAINLYVNLWILLAVAGYAAAAGGIAWPATAGAVAAAAGATLLFVVAIGSWFAAAPMIPPVRVALLFNIEPLVSIAAAAMLLEERLSPLQLAGAAIALGAVALVTLRGRPEQP